ncbi:MAG: hypothetical protein NC306_12625 [Butyrivibrio sp.]|nr:hypothetical protein [Butyrivibrio sp.]
MGPHNIWWPHYRLFSDYMKRISYLMTDSLSFARVAVLCDNNRVPAEEVAGLYENQVDFHYLPVAMLKDCEVRENSLCIGAYRFDVVVDLYGYQNQEAYAAYLAGIPVVRDAASVEIREYQTVTAKGSFPSLRAVHMQKEGISWYLFSNEGEETIETEITVKELRDGRKPFLIRLWDFSAEDAAGRAQDSAAQGVPRNGGSGIRLKLEHCEMKLLLLLNENEKNAAGRYWSDNGLLKNGEGIFLGDWTGQFRYAGSNSVFVSGDYVPDADRDKNSVTCQYCYTVPKGQTITGTEYFSVTGEEMAECVCNGVFTGVSFYGPHQFRIGHLLKEGENKICLRFTGNAVNLYGAVNVPFGLENEQHITYNRT